MDKTIKPKITPRSPRYSMTLRLPAPLHDEISQAAQQDGTTRTDWLMRAARAVLAAKAKEAVMQ